MSDEKRLIKFLLGNYAEVGVVGRPVLNHSETIKVYYGLSLVQILDLDEKNQVLQTNVWSRYVSTDWFSGETSYRLAGGETISPPPMAVWFAADLRPSADVSAVRTWLSYRQPACLQPRAAGRLGQLSHGTDGQTDGRIAVSLNAPYGGGQLRAWRKVMTAYRRVYGSRHLQVECACLKPPPPAQDQLRNPTLGNRAWATFIF